MGPFHTRPGRFYLGATLRVPIERVDSLAGRSSYPRPLVFLVDHINDMVYNTVVNDIDYLKKNK